jgi:hypothetical protein
MITPVMINDQVTARLFRKYQPLAIKEGISVAKNVMPKTPVMDAI